MAPSLQTPLPKFQISNAQIATYVLFAIFGYTVVKPIIQALVSPLRRVPGPFLARFTRLWEVYVIHKHNHATYNIKLHEKYGPIVRLAPNRYSINDAEATKAILGYHNALDKSKYYNAFGTPTGENSFAETSIAAHAKIRRPIAQLYTNNQLLSYEPFVDTCNSILLKRLREYAINGKELDVRELMQYYAFDVIGEITCGSRFGLMEENGDKSGIISAIDVGLIHSARVGLVPELHKPLVALAQWLNLHPGLTAVQEFVRTRIEDRQSGRTKSKEDRQDFIDKMLELEQQGKANRNNTISACGQNVGAGSDTTAISLAATIAYLAMYPNTLAKLREELAEAASKRELSEPIKFKEAQKLPYLQGVIYEALRLHSAVGAPLARVVRKGGAQYAGQYFPAGTEVGVNAWVIHYNKDIFGPDAHVFRPERWLTNDPEERAKLDRNFLAFGTGPRTCIGKNISLLEMSKVIPEIVKKYDFEMLTDEKTGNKYDWKTFWFTKQDFKCRVTARKA